MKKLFLLFVLIAISFESVLACTIEITPLRKNFRQAKEVYVGEIISVQKKSDSEIPKDFGSYGANYKEIYQIHLKIIKSWKSVNKNKQAILYSTDFCGCPYRKYSFKVGDKMLAFTYKYQEFDICNLYSAHLESRFVEENNISTSYLEEAQKTIKKLDSFGFRLWARIYPF